LNSQVFTYDFTANENEVIARGLLAVPGSSFAFSSATAVASWVQLLAGAELDIVSIVQNDWNLNTMSDLDPSKGNVFQIQMQYLGFGALTFSIEDSASGILTPVHRIAYANDNTLPSVFNPTFRLGWASRNIGNTTPVVVRGASAAGFVEGAHELTERSRAILNTNPVTTTQSNILTVRNRLVFGLRRNRVEAKGLLLTLATDANKPVVVGLHRGAVFGGELKYEYLNKEQSVLECAKDSVTTTNGEFIGAFVVTDGASVTVDLSAIDFVLLSDEVVTIDAYVTAGAGGDLTASLTMKEDL